jgi:hypothetical protein
MTNEARSRAKMTKTFLSKFLLNMKGFEEYRTVLHSEDSGFAECFPVMNRDFLCSLVDGDAAFR